MSSIPPVRTDQTISADEARRIALRAQGLLGGVDRRGGVPGLLRRLGAIQLDTISVLARSHELVAHARLGAVGRETIETAYWGPANPATAFEYWAHAACVLPAEEWPWFGFRRRAYLRRGQRWHRVPERTCQEVLARLRTEGPLTTTELGGAKRSADWWDWSDVKIALEWLLDTGAALCVTRRGWKRVYDLPERALDPTLLASEPDDEACLRRLTGLAGRALGVATRADLADYYRFNGDQTRLALTDQALLAGGLVPVRVQGWTATGWADPEALASLARRGQHRTTLLSPFDSLIWDRRRTERIFGFSHRLEAYVPREKRQHGYFAMPLLAGGQLLGRVDPARDGRTLVARQLSLTTAKAVEPMAVALREAAEWVGCDTVRLERVEPAPLAGSLAAAVG